MPKWDVFTLLCKVVGEIDTCSAVKGQIMYLAGELARMDDIPPGAGPADGVPPHRAPRNYRTIASSMYKTSIFRDEVVGDALCRDPVWNMMLDLFTAAQDGSQVTVSSLCSAARVPFSTALRQIGVMERAGLVTRNTGANRRLVHIEPTAKTLDAVVRVIDRLSDGTEVRSAASAG